MISDASSSPNHSVMHCAHSVNTDPYTTEMKTDYILNSHIHEIQQHVSSSIILMREQSINLKKKKKKLKMSLSSKDCIVKLKLFNTSIRWQQCIYIKLMHMLHKYTQSLNCEFTDDEKLEAGRPKLYPSMWGGNPSDLILIELIGTDGTSALPHQATGV